MAIRGNIILLVRVIRVPILICWTLRMLNALEELRPVSTYKLVSDPENALIFFLRQLHCLQLLASPLSPTPCSHIHGLV